MGIQIIAGGWRFVHTSQWGFYLSIAIGIIAQFIGDAWPGAPSWVKPSLFWFAVILFVVCLCMFAHERGLSTLWRGSNRLRLSYRPEAPFIVTPVANLPEGRANSRWFRVRLEGDNPSVRVSLVRVERQRDGRFLDQRFGLQQQLAWSNHMGDDCWTAKRLRPGEPLMVDVLWIDEIRNQIIVTWQHNWNENAGLFAEPGVYRLTLRAFGEGGKNADLVLRLNWSGAWDNTQVIEDRVE